MVLDGIWEFCFLPDCGDPETLDPAGIETPDPIPVPSAFDAYPAWAGRRGTALYRRRFPMTPGRAGELEFESAGMWVRVWIDGVPCGEHTPGYVPFTIPVPPADAPVREVTVVVDNRQDRKRAPLYERFFDFYCYGGIFRSVTLYELPELFFRRCEVAPRDAAAGIVSVKLELAPAFTGERPLRFAFDSGAELERSVRFEAGMAELELTVPSPRLWSPESPQLHTLRVDAGTDDVTVRFGLRELRTEAGRILLNGRPVKLLGVCRHEAHPQFGPALPDAQLVQDLQLIRRLGCNFVRGVHYPQDRRFLELCDELGILVWEESLGWGQNRTHFTDPIFVAAQLEQTRAMIRASYNHPCVILRGFLNEGESDAEEARNCYESLIRLIREEDPGRLVTYASFKRRTDLFLDQVDVIGYNTYPGWYNAVDDENPVEQVLPKMRSDIAFLQGRPELRDKPLIFSEIGGGAIYGWHDALNGPWTEEFQEELLRTICREVVRNRRIAGVALWQFCDCRTCNCGRALGRPRAFNNKGLFDEYRRPKRAAAAVAAVFSGYWKKRAREEK